MDATTVAPATSLLEAYLPTINSLGLVILAFAVFYTQFRSGAKKVTNEVISNYETLDKQQKEKIADQQEQIIKYQTDMAEIKTSMQHMKEDFAKQIGDLQGQLTAKDKQVVDLQNTILNRNPDLENVLKEIRDFMKEIRNSNLHQTSILEGQEVRDSEDRQVVSTKAITDDPTHELKDR